ncbi:MAG TPA: hypothetical protein VGP93_11985 [Polyangiaceae bacterium]|nr:hypothetical protein [Polyangiaceae bacterium]
MESDEIHVLAFAVLRRLQQIDYALEARLSREGWSDIGETHGQDRVHLDLTFLHAVTPTHFDVGAHPDSDAASDLAPTHSFSQTFAEDHGSRIAAT